MAVPLLSLKVRTWPMPGTESLRSSLLMPSADSALASSPKTELGAASTGSGRASARRRVAWCTGGVLAVHDQGPPFGGEKGPVVLALAEHRPRHFGPVGDLPIEVLRLEGDVSDASWLDHGSLQSRNV